MRLSPDPAHAAARIAVVFDESSPDRATCSFEWRRNGFVIDGATRSELEPTMFAKGDIVTVLVHVSSTTAEYARPLTAEVQVANSAPRIESVGLEMFAAPAGSEVQAIVACVDPDGDSPDLEYQWFRNGAAIKGAQGASIPASTLVRGDRLTVAVIARDDQSASAPKESQPFSVENLPPAFASQPGALGAGDAEFQYQAIAVDPDGDPLRYELVDAPKGMTLGSAGQVHWALPEGDGRRGAYPVRLRAMDANGGEAVQAFTIQLSASNSAR